MQAKANGGTHLAQATARGRWLDVEDYPELGRDWVRLQETAQGSPFTHWHWISTWMDHLPVEVKPRVFRADDDHGLLALALAVDARERGHRRLFGRRSLLMQETGNHALDEISVEYTGLLARRFGEVDAYAALFRTLERDWGGRRRFRISATADGPAIAAALPESLRGYSIHRLPCYRIDLSALRASGKPYIDSLGRNLRHHLRQSQRAYEVHGALRVEVARNTDVALAWLEQLRLLHERRWQSKGKEGAFASEFFHAFHQDLVRKGVADGFVQLTRVSAGPLVIGYLYNLYWRGTLYFYNCGLNYGALPRYDSPGSLALAACIQHCLDAGLEAFDFLAGEQDYKRRLSSHARSLEWIDVRRCGLAHDSEWLLARALGTGTFGLPLAHPTSTHPSSE